MDKKYTIAFSILLLLIVAITAINLNSQKVQFSPLEIGGCADYNEDGFVDIADQGIFSLTFESIIGNSNYNPLADFDNNGIINLEDFDCFNRYFQENVNCPEDTQYCGCNLGCSDLNGDGAVDITDYASFGNYFETKKGDLNYNPIVDFDNDEKIDDYDFSCFEKTMSTYTNCYYDFKGGCADYDSNGVVDTADYGTFGLAFESIIGNSNYNPLADFDNNGIINSEDFSCFKKTMNTHINCPEDTQYCGCDFGCADLDGDGNVDASDYGTFGLAYEANTESFLFNHLADFDNNGIINSEDFSCFEKTMNTNVDCYLKYSIPQDRGCADYSDDGVVDLTDITILGKSLGKQIGDLGYDPQTDFDDNGIVNQIDVKCFEKSLYKNINCPSDAETCGCISGCADLDGNKIVDGIDFSILGTLSYKVYNEGYFDENLDYDGDGEININRDSLDFYCFELQMGTHTECYSTTTGEDGTTDGNDGDNSNDGSSSGGAIGTGTTETDTREGSDQEDEEETKSTSKLWDALGKPWVVYTVLLILILVLLIFSARQYLNRKL